MANGFPIVYYHYSRHIDPFKIKIRSCLPNSSHGLFQNKRKIITMTYKFLLIWPWLHLLVTLSPHPLPFSPSPMWLHLATCCYLIVPSIIPPQDLCTCCCRGWIAFSPEMLRASLSTPFNSLLNSLFHLN